MGETTGSAADFLPRQHSLDALRRAAAGCKGCHLFEQARQTVFGEGPRNAEVVIVGEVPGDQEDKQGHPFVGPAGGLLDRALNDAGIKKDEVYITNAVKHFKWEPRGKRRLHKKPSNDEIQACRPWLVAELEAIHPQVLVCMGATAARSAFDKTVRIKDYRGRLVASPLHPATFVTVHPSAVLRLPDSTLRHAEYDHLVDDLRHVASRLH